MTWGTIISNGYEKDLLKPREYAREEFLAVIDGLEGKVQLEAAVTHMHPDHDGMAGASPGRNIPLWAGAGEDMKAAVAQQNLDPSFFQTFTHGTKKIDLGLGRIVETIKVRGQSNGETVFIIKKDMLVFWDDAPGSGSGQAFSTIERLKQVTEDSQDLVNCIKTNLSPYEKYGLMVSTGQWWQNAYVGFLHPN